MNTFIFSIILLILFFFVTIIIISFMRVFILIFLKQTMSLGNTVLQLFCCYRVSHYLPNPAVL